MTFSQSGKATPEASVGHTRGNGVDKVSRRKYSSLHVRPAKYTLSQGCVRKGSTHGFIISREGHTRSPSRTRQESPGQTRQGPFSCEVLEAPFRPLLKQSQLYTCEALNQFLRYCAWKLIPQLLSTTYRSCQKVSVYLQLCRHEIFCLKIYGLKS